MDLCQVPAAKEGGSRWKSTPGTSQAWGVCTCIVVEDNAYRVIPVWVAVEQLILGLCLDSMILKVFSNLNYSIKKNGNQTAGKGLGVVCDPSSCSKQSQLCSHIALLRACWVFEISKDRELTNLPGSPSHWLAALTRKTFLHISNQSPFFWFL